MALSDQLPPVPVADAGAIAQGYELRTIHTTLGDDGKTFIAYHALYEHSDGTYRVYHYYEGSFTDPEIEEFDEYENLPDYLRDEDNDSDDDDEEN